MEEQIYIFMLQNVSYSEKFFTLRKVKNMNIIIVYHMSEIGYALVT